RAGRWQSGRGDSSDRTATDPMSATRLVQGILQALASGKPGGGRRRDVDLLARLRIPTLACGTLGRTKAPEAGDADIVTPAQGGYDSTIVRIEERVHDRAD